MPARRAQELARSGRYGLVGIRERSDLLRGTLAIARTNPDYDVLQVMNKVIGGGPTGRLFIHLREEKGYTYGAFSYFSMNPFYGFWAASAGETSGPF